MLKSRLLIAPQHYVPHAKAFSNNLGIDHQEFKHYVAYSISTIMYHTSSIINCCWS